jgi:hypothetical protein
MSQRSPCADAGSSTPPRIFSSPRAGPAARQPLATRRHRRRALSRGQRGDRLGRVVSAPGRARDTATRADAPGTVDMGRRCRGRRSSDRRSPRDCRPRAASPFAYWLAGLPADRRAACARGVGWPDRSERRATYGTGPLPLSRRARRSWCATTAAPAPSLRAAPTTNWATNLGGDSTPH